MNNGTPAARAFEFRNVTGLSRAALDLHLDLYRGYVQQVKALHQLEVELAGAIMSVEARRLCETGVTQQRSFEAAGMRLHELFFEQLDGEPTGPAPAAESRFALALSSSFMGTEDWIADIGRLAATRGVGWVVCFQEPGSLRLSNHWIAEHHLGIPIGQAALAVFDLWEHAYLPDFPDGKRDGYLETILANMDWSVVERRCISGETRK